MKKQIVAIALIGSLALATTATANWGKGGGRGYGGCGQMQQSQQLDPETKAKVQQFLKDHQGLRKELTMKRAEKRALMQSDNPSPEVAAKIAGELFDLRTQMREKAEAAGVDQYVGKGRKGFGGPGNRGRHHGRGPGPGMMQYQ